MVERAAEIGFLVLLVAGIPAMSWVTAHDPHVRTAPRRSLYFSAVFSEWLFAALGVAAVRVAGFHARDIGFKGIAPGALVRWTLVVVAITAAGLGVLELLERRGWWPPEAELVRLLMPHTGAEKAWALALMAPTAALVEEFLYRGYLFGILARTLDSMAWAWALSSVAFGVAHLYQKPSGVLRATLLGALLAWPLARTGSVYPSVAAHFLIDAAAFGWLGPRTLFGKEGPGAANEESR
jgi:CAAX protease family protein